MFLNYYTHHHSKLRKSVAGSPSQCPGGGTGSWRPPPASLKTTQAEEVRLQKAVRGQRPLAHQGPREARDHRGVPRPHAGRTDAGRQLHCRAARVQGERQVRGKEEEHLLQARGEIQARAQISSQAVHPKAEIFSSSSKIHTKTKVSQTEAPQARAQIPSSAQIPSRAIQA